MKIIMKMGAKNFYPQDSRGGGKNEHKKKENSSPSLSIFTGRTSMNGLVKG